MTSVQDNQRTDDLFSWAARGPITAPPKRHRLQQAFEAFHASNPHVYELFKRFAKDARCRCPRYSADSILHRIRWFAAIETNDPSGWKINNNWSAFYARLLIKEEPSFAGFFERRVSAADQGEECEAVSVP